MKYLLLSCASLLIATSALAEDKPQAQAQAQGGMDMSKMGPWSRKPTNEKQTKKEITDFMKQEEELHKKGDFDGSIARIDFPVYMFTDDAKGVPEGDSWTKEKYVAMMKPFFDNMPKDMKVTHKPNITVLSDSLVTLTDEFTMTMGKQKFSGKNVSVLVKRDGQWKWKVMGEAGWGGAPSEQHADAKPAAQQPAAQQPATKK